MKTKLSKLSLTLSGHRSIWLVFVTIALLILPSSIAAAQPHAEIAAQVASPFAANVNQCVDFNQLPPNTSVEGLGTVNKNLNISTSTGGAVTLQENQDPFAYRSLNGTSNFGMGALGGFADKNRIHDYSFSFAPGVAVSSFSVRMLDYGDFDPVGATEHNVTLVAFDATDTVVATDSLVFTSDGSIDESDELWITGDSTAEPGNPGNYTFSVAGSGIVRLEMQYSSDLGVGATDPLHGLTVLCFAVEGDDGPDIPAGATCADFTQVAPGSSVEGLGTLNPLLNITTSSGGAVALQENMDPFAYRALNGESNFGMGILGGFSDSAREHNYTFTFAPGVTMSDFTLQLLDYGDFDPVGATEHAVTAVAYNAADEIVTTQTLYFTSDGFIDESDELWLTGDATTTLGNPGNFLFVLSGTGITRVELEYASDVDSGVTDPLHGLAVLCFEPEQSEPVLDPPTAALTLLRPKPAPYIGGKYHVEYACSETAPNLVSATINGYDVVNGQDVNLVVGDRESARIVNDQLIWLFAPEFSFDVTCADDSGNQVSTTVVPEFDMP